MKSHILFVKIRLRFPRKSSALWMKNHSFTTKVMIANTSLLAQSPVSVLPAVLSSVAIATLMTADGFAQTTNRIVVPESTLHLMFVMVA